MASINIAGDTSGTLTLSAPLVAGTNTVTLPAATGTISLLARATAVASTSGTSIDFTGIPSWAKRITVMFSVVSLSGTDSIQIQIGDLGGIENTGYTSNSSSGSTNTSSTTSYLLTVGGSASDTASGIVTLVNLSGNTWSCSGLLNFGGTKMSAGVKTLSDVLTTVRILPTGSNTFDAGSINIMYEG